MSKTPSEKLFRLVKSLSPAEKRHFKIMFGGQIESEKKYLQLFDLIDHSKQSRDEFYKKKIYKNQISESRKFPELKSYLYESILKSLQHFDEKQAIGYKLNHLLQGVNVLFKRGLYDDCKELLQKVIRLAKQHEQFAYEIEAIRWEKQLAYTQMDVDFLHKTLDRLHDEETRALEKMQNEILLRQYFFKTYTTIKRDAQSRDMDSKARLIALLPPTFFSELDIAKSHRARVLYYRTLSLFYYGIMDLENFYESGKKLIEIIENQQFILKENLSDYIATLSNLILSCGLMNRYEEVRECLVKLKNLPAHTEDDRRKIHRQYYTGKLVLCIFTGEFEEGRQEMERHLAEINQFNPPETQTSSFYFQYFCICFGSGDYDLALDYLNQWLNQPRTVEREDLQSVARILSLILHFEMGNLMLLESLLRSTTRYLQSKDRYFDLERHFVHFMGSLIRAVEKEQQLALFTQFFSEIEPISKEPAIEAMLQTFDLLSWVNSKILRKTFAQTVREKYEKQQFKEDI